MPEVTAAELRKLRTLETRVVTANATLGEARAKHKQLQAELTATRRDLREAERNKTGADNQVEHLIAENARLAAALEETLADLKVVSDETSRLREGNQRLEASLTTTKATANKANADAKKAAQAQGRLEKQLATISEKLAADEPPEVTPDQLSELLSGFIDQIGGRTGMEMKGTKINLRVGFSGRGGGSFVVPSLGVDTAKLPELHDVQFELTRRPTDGLRSPDD